MRNTTEISCARVLAFACFIFCLCVYYFGAAATGFDLAALQDPSALVTGGEIGAKYGSYSMLSDILGFYLLQIPIAIILWRYFRDNNPALLDHATVAGVLYCLTGAIGAGILATNLPTIISAYEAAPDEVSRQIYAMAYKVTSDQITIGVWGRVEFFLAAIWWGLMGLSVRAVKPIFGWISVLLGLASFIAWLGYMFSVQMIATAGLNLYMLLVPIWLLTITISFRNENE